MQSTSPPRGVFVTPERKENSIEAAAPVAAAISLLAVALQCIELLAASDVAIACSAPAPADDASLSAPAIQLKKGYAGHIVQHIVPVPEPTLCTLPSVVACVHVHFSPGSHAGFQ